MKAIKALLMENVSSVFVKKAQCRAANAFFKYLEQP